MDIIKSAAEALKPVSDSGIRVQAGWYDESIKDTHVTLWYMGDYEGGHSDDGVEIDVASIQVCIWSQGIDQQQLKKRIKKLMKKAGFYYTEGTDQLEADTGIFMNAMRFLLMEEAEEYKED